MVLAKWQRTAATTAVVLSGCGGLASLSCGGGSEQPATVRATLAEALAAFERRDAGELCDSLSTKAREVIGHAMHAGAPLECVRDVKPFLSLVGRYRSEATIAGSTRRGPGRAVARLRLPDGAVVTIPLSREDGRWRLDGLFDASLSRIQVRGTPREASRALERPPGPLEPGGVVVRDLTSPRGPRCPATSTARYPKVTGGCLVTTAQETVRLSLRTAFGAMRFAECEVSYDVRVDGSGRGWIVNIAVAGRNPCFDALPCWDREDRQVPWRARIERDDGGRLRLRVRDACLDTCVGRFEGRWEIAMTERRRSWRLRSASMVGTSGWRFDGGVTSDGKRIAIE